MVIIWHTTRERHKLPESWLYSLFYGNFQRVKTWTTWGTIRSFHDCSSQVCYILHISHIQLSLFFCRIKFLSYCSIFGGKVYSLSCTLLLINTTRHLENFIKKKIQEIQREHFLHTFVEVGVSAENGQWYTVKLFIHELPEFGYML